MIRRFAFVLMLAATGWASAAFADNDPVRGDAEACQPDIHRLCDKFFPDATLVAACLVDRRAELSVACAEVLARPEVVARPDASATPAKP